MRYRISEANLSDSMKFVFDRWVKPLDTRNILDYEPKSQKQTANSWIKDNPTTGLIFLKDRPEVKEAWMLVKFSKPEPTYNMQNRPTEYKTLRNVQDFTNFFGVAPQQNWFSDTICVVSWNKQLQMNTNPNRDFDETTPDFYMYINHLKTSLTNAISRIYDIADNIIDEEDNYDKYRIPYSKTNAKK